MALRTIRVQGDPILNKVCRPITEVTPKIRTLAEDMIETMYEANGVGLAAPQVGILKRIVVIDVGDGQGPYPSPDLHAAEAGACCPDPRPEDPDSEGDPSRPGNGRARKEIHLWKRAFVAAFLFRGDDRHDRHGKG